MDDAHMTLREKWGGFREAEMKQCISKFSRKISRNKPWSETHHHHHHSERIVRTVYLLQTADPKLWLLPSNKSAPLFQVLKKINNIYIFHISKCASVLFCQLLYSTSQCRIVSDTFKWRLEDTDLRAGDWGRTWTRMKPMLCRYWTYCWRKELEISSSQGSSFNLLGSISAESVLWLRSRPDAVESLERCRFW